MHTETTPAGPANADTRPCTCESRNDLTCPHHGPRLCPSCGHEIGRWHREDGCWHAVVVGKQDANVVCPCAVSWWQARNGAPPPEDPPALGDGERVWVYDHPAEGRMLVVDAYGDRLMLIVSPPAELEGQFPSWPLPAATMLPDAQVTELLLHLAGWVARNNRRKAHAAG